MLARLLAELAIPSWLRPLLPYVLLAAGAVAAWLWFAGHYYDQGYAARSAEVERVAAAYRERIAAINTRNAATGAKADATIAALRRGDARDRTDLQEAIQRVPEFAAVRRPADLHARRVRQLDTIAGAAADRELRD